MKRLITSLALALVIPASALAATPYQALSDFNDWLYGNDMYGINYINTQLKTTKKEAHKNWNEYAALFDFTFYTPSGQDLFCEINLSSWDNDENDYRGTCTADETPLTEVVENRPNILYRNHIYGVDFLLRDVIPAMMEDEKLMTKLENLYGKDADLSLEYNLSRNSAYHLMWTITFTDENGLSYMVKTSAEEAENPQFIILRKET